MCNPVSLYIFIFCSNFKYLAYTIYLFLFSSVYTVLHVDLTYLLLFFYYF